MPPSEEGNKLAEGAKTYGQLGGIIAAVLLGIWPHVNPASMMDQGVVDASVTVATRQVVDDAEEKIDAKVDKEVRTLKESLSDKIDGIRTAVGGLKELTLEKARSTEKDIRRMRENVDDLKDSLYDSRSTTRTLKKQVRRLEQQISTLERTIESVGAYTQPDFMDLGPELMGSSYEEENP